MSELGASVGARLRAIRTSLGMTQADVAAGVAVQSATRFNRTHVARAENGKHCPSVDLIDRLCKSMGVHISRVFEP